MPIETDEQYKNRMFEIYKKKAEKWDALSADVAKCYMNADGILWEETEDFDEDAGGRDLEAIGEKAASHLGWL